MLRDEARAREARAREARLVQVAGEMKRQGKLTAEQRQAIWPQGGAKYSRFGAEQRSVIVYARIRLGGYQGEAGRAVPIGDGQTADKEAINRDR